MYKNIITIIAGLSMPVANAIETSANVNLTTDYVFRGISQTDEQSAIQGGFDIESESGFYIGTWGSSINFGSNASAEFDYYGGYNFELSENIKADVGMLYYHYPSSDANESFLELYASASYSDVTLGINYSNDYFAETGRFAYLFGEYQWTLPQELTVSLKMGYNKWSKESDAQAFWGSATVDSGYLDWGIHLSKPIGVITLDFGVVGTDIAENVCTEWCDTRFVLSISSNL